MTVIEVTEEEDIEDREKMEMENPLWLPLPGKTEIRRRHRAIIGATCTDLYL